MASMSEALDLHQVKRYKLPLPINAIEVQIDGKTIAYQGEL
jgi:hypothetical protein